MQEKLSRTQKIIRFFSSAKFFEKAKADSKKWYFNCDCNSTFSILDIGGVKYKGTGNKKMYVKFTNCKKNSLQVCS
jgi:hypothetical protein